MFHKQVSIYWVSKINMGVPQGCTAVTLKLCRNTESKIEIYMYITRLHSEQPKLYGVLAVLSAIGLIKNCLLRIY